MGWFGIGGTAKNYTPTTYGGRTPPNVDFNDPSAGGYLAGNFPSSLQGLIQGPNGQGANTFRPVQSLYTGLVANRAQGNDVGYSPEWMKSSTDLLKSNIGQAKTEALRNSAGALSASGLSGNPRAYEATSGRTNSDYDQKMKDALSALTISDMERKNQERDVNTGRLGALNTQNFNQENTGANFDLNQWQEQNQLGLSAANLAANNYWAQQQQNEQAVQDIGQGVGMAAGGMGAGPSAIALSQLSGQGVAPTGISGAGYQTSLKQSPEYARLMSLRA